MAIATLDRIATDVRDPRARSYIPLHRARRALMEGRAEEAERLIDEGVKLAWSLHDSTVPILAGAQLFSLRRAQGRLGELENAVHQFADSLPAMPAWRCALAVLYLDDGRELEARRELEHLAARGFADFPRDNVWMVSMALLAELCEGLDDGEHAAEVETAARAVRGAQRRLARGHLRRPGHALSRALRRGARRLGRRPRPHGGRARGGRAAVARADARAARPRRGAHPRPARRARRRGDGARGCSRAPASAPARSACR